MRAAQIHQLVRALSALGPLRRDSLARISHANRWRDGCLDAAISEGIRQGKLRRLPFDFLAASRPRGAERRADPMLANHARRDNRRG